MDFKHIKQAIYDGDTQILFEIINDEDVLCKFFNEDPRALYVLLSSTIGVYRNSLDLDNVNEIYDNIISQFVKVISDLFAASENNLTLLMFVLRVTSDFNVATELINRGADINCQDEDGWTPLIYAVRADKCEKDFIMTVLKAGSNVHALNNEGKNVLMITDCNCIFTRNCKAKESIDLLLQYGINDADLKHTDNDGNTILHLTNCKYLFELAIKSGVSIEAKNNEGWTPLLNDFSFEKCYNGEKIVYLLESGANVNSTNEGTYLPTALHLCSWMNDECVPSRTIDLLIYRGGNIHARNIHNQTPLDLIIERDDFNKKLAFVIPKHIILFDDDEFDFGKEIYEKFYLFQNQYVVMRPIFSSFIVSCKKELTLMRETFIADGLTFYEFCILKRFYKSKCINISCKYSCSEIRQLFPVYSNVIIIRIKDNCLKKRELDSRKRFEKITFSAVHTEDTNVYEVLNYDCLYHISRYLNYKEIFNVFSAATES